MMRRNKRHLVFEEELVEAALKVQLFPDPRFLLFVLQNIVGYKNKIKCTVECMYVCMYGHHI